MQGAEQAAAHAPGGTAAATEALAVPLLQLLRAAGDARMRLRLPRAMELYERALVLTETTMPVSTLLVAWVLQQIMSTRTFLAAGSAAVTMDAAVYGPITDAAWRDDEQLLQRSQRCLGLLCGRWVADTLLTPTAEEVYYAECFDRTAETLGAELFATWAMDALAYWPCALVVGADCLHGIHEALLATLAMQAMQRTRCVGLALSTSTVLCYVLQVVLDNASWLHRLRSTCGLTQADEAKLRMLHHELLQGRDARDELHNSSCGAVSALAAADVARYGLRSCALPSCGTTEQYLKTYKLCGRCRGVVAYCCAAHSKEDWKRHKREDGCAAPS
jgi:hypothetical protein